MTSEERLARMLGGVRSGDSTVMRHYIHGPGVSGSHGGVIGSRSGAVATNNPFRFSTKYADEETGLVYYGYRFYAPELGRWVSRDPVGERGFLVAGNASIEDLLNSPEPQRLQTGLSMLQEAIAEAIPRGPSGGMITQKELMNLFRFSHNQSVNVVDILGLACGPGQSGDKWIPDSIWGVFDFEDCCTEHDECYGDCNGPPRAVCDLRFWLCTVKSCRKYWYNFMGCMNAAHAYAGAVALFGGPSFKNARKCCGKSVSP